MSETFLTACIALLGLAVLALAGTIIALKGPGPKSIFWHGLGITVEVRPHSTTRREHRRNERKKDGKES